MLELVGTIATICAIVGVILNNHRRRECFIVFLFSNCLTLGIHAYLSVWSVCVRDAAFLALAVHGWVAWGRPKKI